MLEIDKLPEEIKQKIIFDKKIYGLNRKSEFINYIENNDKLLKLEKTISIGCIDKKSIYDKCHKITINGYNCVKLSKKYKLYKIYSGFITEAYHNMLIENNIYSNYIFYSKYQAYSLARLMFGGILSFKLNDDLILLDYFDSNNLEKIINKLKIVKHHDYIINDIQNSTGYNVSKNDQIIYYNNRFKPTNIFLYNKIIYPKYNIIHKNIINDEKLSPFKLFPFDTPYLYIHEKLIFENILNDIPEINGLIKKQMSSYISLSGVYDEEQIYIKSSFQKKYMKIDYDNNLTWNNWKIKYNNKIYENIIILLYFQNKMHGEFSNNKNFQILEFIIKNNKLNKYQIKQHSLNNKLLYLDMFNGYNTSYMSNTYSYILKTISFIKKIIKLSKNLDIIYIINDKLNNKFNTDLLFNNLIKYKYKYIISFNNNKLVSKIDIKHEIIDITIIDKIIINKKQLSYFNYPYYDIKKKLLNINTKDQSLLIYYLNNKIIFINLLNYIDYSIKTLKKKTIKIINSIYDNIYKTKINMILKYKSDIIILVIYAKFNMKSSFIKLLYDNKYELCNKKKISYNNFYIFCRNKQLTTLLINSNLYLSYSVIQNLY